MRREGTRYSALTTDAYLINSVFNSKIGEDAMWNLFMSKRSRKVDTRKKFARCLRVEKMEDRRVMAVAIEGLNIAGDANTPAQIFDVTAAGSHLYISEGNSPTGEHRTEVRLAVVSTNGELIDVPLGNGLKSHNYKRQPAGTRTEVLASLHAGSAARDGDFIDQDNVQIVLPAGDLGRPFVVEIAKGLQPESNEWFDAEIGRLSGMAVLQGGKTLRVRIINDDGPIILGIQPGALAITEGTPISQSLARTSDVNPENNLRGAASANVTLSNVRYRLSQLSASTGGVLTGTSTMVVFDGTLLEAVGTRIMNGHTGAFGITKLASLGTLYQAGYTGDYQVDVGITSTSSNTLLDGSSTRTVTIRDAEVFEFQFIAPNTTYSIDNQSLGFLISTNAVIRNSAQLAWTDGVRGTSSRSVDWFAAGIDFPGDTAQLGGSVTALDNSSRFGNANLGYANSPVGLSVSATSLVIGPGDQLTLDVVATDRDKLLNATRAGFETQYLTTNLPGENTRALQNPVATEVATYSLRYDDLLERFGVGVHQIQFTTHDDSPTQADASSTQSRVLTVEVLPPIPKVAQIVLNSGQSQRSSLNSMQIIFNSQVAISPGAFELRNQAGEIVEINYALQNVGGVTRANLTFSGTSTRSGGALHDGNYVLTINSLLVEGNGKRMLADFVYGDDENDLYSLFGDINGDRTVNLMDFYQFRASFAGAYNAAFDYNANGVIDISDFAAFRTRFGRTI